MNQLLRDAAPIRMSLQKFRLLVPRLGKNHQGDHIKLKTGDGKNEANS